MIYIHKLFFFIKAQFIFNVSVGLKLMNSRSFDDA